MFIPFDYCPMVFSEASESVGPDVPRGRRNVFPPAPRQKARATIMAQERPNFVDRFPQHGSEESQG